MAGGRLIVGSQYGEEDTIIQALGCTRDGLLLDIGAADGLHHSNTRRLLTEYGWYGVLCEPHPVYAEELRKRYAGNERVLVHEYAVKGHTGECRFFRYEPSYYGQVSTTVLPFRDLVITQHGDQYVSVQSVTCLASAEIVRRTIVHGGERARIAFVNLDCEGAEREVLEQWPWYEPLAWPRVWCVEMALWPDEIARVLTEHSYSVLAKIGGNVIWSYDRAPK